MNSDNDNHIKAMIRLLDDPDQDIYQQVSTGLISLGRDVVPMLEEAWSGVFDPLVQERIENIVHKIQFDSLKDDLSKWAVNQSNDLLAGAILVARYQYPDLDEDKIRLDISMIRKDAWSEIRENMSPHDQIAILNRIFFEQYGFSGNTANFHAPQNSFINTVLESKRGNPLMLSLIYMVVAHRLDIPVYGINLPEHFILAYQDVRGDSWTEYTYPEAGILFYINAFSKGAIFYKNDIEQFLKKLNLQSNRIFYEPCTNHDIIRRMIRNLIFSWQKLGEPEKVNELNQLLDCLNPRSLSSPESSE